MQNQLKSIVVAVAVCAVGTGNINAADVTGDRANIGTGHQLSGSWATIGGGSANTNSSPYAAISGGLANWIMANSSGGVVSGGGNNIIYTNALWAAINGGLQNQIYPDAWYAWIGGGSLNEIETGGVWGSIGGGWFNIIEEGSIGSTISGGLTNVIDEGTLTGTIGGGRENYIGVDSHRAGIFGGYANQILSGSQSSFIGGGQVHIIYGDASFSTIAGGSVNLIYNQSGSSTISGGSNNRIWTNSSNSTIGGGNNNNIYNGSVSSTIPGGEDNYVEGDYAFAAGRKASASHNGAFVWSDSIGTTFASTNNNEFAVRAYGGVRLQTGATNGVAAGVKISPGSGTWETLSDRNAKANFKAINAREVLAKLAKLPLATWNYRTEDENVRHIGPVAQDFHAAFALGGNDRTITTVDADGVALAAIQGLHELLKEKDTALQEQQKTVDELSARLQALEKVFLNQVSAK